AQAKRQVFRPLDLSSTLEHLSSALAGVPGFETGLSVLETDVLTVDTIPLRILSISNCQFSCLTQPTPNRQSEIGNRQRSLGLFVIRVFAAATAELTKLQPLGRSLFVL